jgi:hypothetical protein
MSDEEPRWPDRMRDELRRRAEAAGYSRIVDYDHPAFDPYRERLERLAVEDGAPTTPAHLVIEAVYAAIEGDWAIDWDRDDPTEGALLAVCRFLAELDGARTSG